MLTVPPSDAQRLAALEDAVARLASDVRDIRSELARQPAGHGTARATELPPRVKDDLGAREAVQSSGRIPSPGMGRIESFNAAVKAKSLDDALASLGLSTRQTAGAASTSPLPRREGLETLIGKYGTLALATLTILLGVGAFLGWAIRSGLLGPELRLALGTVAAGALAAVGWRLRRKGNARFGDVLLALALAVLHVVAWGAGPRLHVVPDLAALCFAALASGALSWLAWREGQQALFNVGAGGALLAPFVTSSGRGDAMVLLGYGIMVIGAGLAALSRRPWSKTPWVIAIAIVGYAAVGIERLSDDVAWRMADAPTMFGLFIAALAFSLSQPPARSRLILTALSVAVVGLVAALDGPSSERPPQVLAVLVTIGALSALTAAERGLLQELVAAFILPVSALATALSALNDATSPSGLAMSLLWAGLSTGAVVLNRDGNRPLHAFTATFATGLGLALATDSWPVAFCVALATLALVAALAWRRYEVPGVGYAGLSWLFVATARAFSMLDERPSYDYPPFLTPASGAAAAVAVAWLFTSWHGSRALPVANSGTKDLSRTLLRLLGVAVAFLWIHQELARAVSPDVSVFLLVAYYATTGVAAIYLGRLRAIPLLRTLGLALAVIAALKTMVEASDLAVGWRVAGYLLAGLFLLGVAYWYRAQSAAAGRSPNDPATEASETPTPSL